MLSFNVETNQEKKTKNTCKTYSQKKKKFILLSAKDRNKFVTEESEKKE